MYHIFKVNDYKGGELDSSVNLTKEELIEQIADYFVTDEDFTLEQWKNVIEETILEEAHLVEKADGLGVIYKSKGSKLERVSWRKLVNHIAEYKIKITNDC